MILDEIVAHKRVEVAERMARVPLDALVARSASASPRPFEARLVQPGRLTILAEIKRQSPSAGCLRGGVVDPVSIARSMEHAGASAISVLTDSKYFGGSLDDLVAARAAVSIPVLEKDFVVGEYQVYEAAAAGADAVLLIVRILPDADLRFLHALAARLGLGCLVETHTREDIERAVAAGASLLGINNRDLATFKTDLETTVRLMPCVPRGVAVVSQSGISRPEEARRLFDAGVAAIQVGESLMRSVDPGAQVRRLLSLV